MEIIDQKLITQYAIEIARHELFSHAFTDKYGVFSPPEIVIDWGNMEVNASADHELKPRIIINEGLLKIVNEEMHLKAILGHEMCHLAYKDRGVINSFFIARVFILVFTFFIGLLIHNYLGVTASVIGGLIFYALAYTGTETIYYSIFKSQEIRADNYGAAIAGVSNMIKALRTVSGSHTPRDKIYRFFSRFKQHPLTEERILLLRAISRQSTRNS